MRVYVINVNDTRKKLDDISHLDYFMGYADTSGFIIYWKPYQPFVRHRDHHIWFDEYNYRLSIENKHTLCSVLLWQNPEGHIHDSDLLNLITCELDITSNPFIYATIVTYDIELPPSGKKVGFNLLDDENFTIPYITDTIPNMPAGRLLP